MKNETNMTRDEIVQMFDLDLCPNDSIEPGDLYIASRNTTHLLVCRFVDYDARVVVPTSLDYPYDIHECVKVREK